MIVSTVGRARQAIQDLKLIRPAIEGLNSTTDCRWSISAHKGTDGPEVQISVPPGDGLRALHLLMSLALDGVEIKTPVRVREYIIYAL